MANPDLDLKVEVLATLCKVEEKNKAFGESRSWHARIDLERGPWTAESMPGWILLTRTLDPKAIGRGS